MPHIIVECSNNLIEKPAASDFFSRLHAVLAAVEPFKMKDFRSRMIRYDDYSVATGEPTRAFVHIQLGILAGRSDEIKKSASTALLEFLMAEFAGSVAKLSCAVSVEVRDINGASYEKFISNP